MSTGKGAGALARRIDRLFKLVQPKGREYSYEEVARGCEALTAGTFSKTYVWQLRTGQRDNPTKRHLEALAAFFGVPVAYFFEDPTDDPTEGAEQERGDGRLALTAALDDADLRDILRQAMGMDDVTRRSLVRIVNVISNMQDARGVATDVMRVEAPTGRAAVRPM